MSATAGSIDHINTRFKTTELKAMKTLDRYPDVDRGWAWLVMIGNFLGIVIYCCTMYMGGVFYISLLDYYREGTAKTSLVGALSTGFLCFFGPIASICINKIGCRPTLMLGGLIITVGNFISAFVHSLDSLIVTAGAITGVGYSISCAALIVSLGYYFDKRRNQILSMSFVMAGAGLFLSAPISLHVLNTYGLSGSFLILGCINAQLIVIGMICRPSSIEKDLQEKRKSQVYKEGEERLTLFNTSMLKNKAFVCFLVSTASWNFALNIGIMHLPNYIAVKTASDSQIGLLMTVYSVANTAGRLLGSLTVGRVKLDSLVIHIAALGVCGVITALFPLYSHEEVGYFIFTVQLGLTMGVPNVLMTPLCIRMVGVKGLSEANGLSYFFCGIGVTAGPVVAGYVFGATGAYEYSFLISGVVLIVGSLFALFAAILLRRSPGKDPLADLAPDTEVFVSEPLSKTLPRKEALMQGFIYSSNGSIMLL